MAYLTTAQVADRLHESTENTTRRCARDQLPAIKVGKRWLIDEDEFDAWMKSKKRVASPRERMTARQKRRAS